MWSCRAPHVPVNLRLTSRDSWAPHERKESGVASPSSSEMGDGRPSASAPTVVDALRSKGQLQSSRLPRFEMGQTSSRPSARSRDPAPRQDWRGLAGSSTFHPASARRLCARINPSRRKRRNPSSETTGTQVSVASPEQHPAPHSLTGGAATESNVPEASRPPWMGARSQGL